MTKRYKTPMWKKWVLWSVPVVISLFLFTLFVMFWSFIKANQLIILGITGGIILLYVFIGVFEWKKFMKGIRRRI
ncbi:hypothetical protein CL617_04930 [archaeon]|nr:hypothetical protein [archaeon]|tara:strand:- start:965 stop:1189 length:225 start_codon:yes stop_codon:yes gene_type:complete